MSEEEFIKLIIWKEVPRQYGTIEIVGEITLSCSYQLNLVDNEEEHKKIVRKTIVENLLRKVYEDRRKEFYEAIDKLYLLHPTDFSGLQDRIDEIMKLAKRQ